jgi:hypothetical protein
MPDLMDMAQSLSEREDDKFDNFGYTRPWDRQDHEKIKDPSYHRCK